MTDEQEKVSILLVDDNEMNRDMLSRRLERKGYKVTSAEDGDEALECIDRDQYDMVLLDITMPKKNGIEVLQIIRQTIPSTDLPIIMVSACDENDKIVTALESGANDYITKPINFSVALARIQSHLSHKKEVTKRVHPSALIKEGKNFANYHIESKIGEGGMGVVYKALDRKLNRPVAIKVILDKDFEAEEYVQRFHQEAQAIAQINHPNIITIYEIEQTPIHYFVMEYIEGETLEVLIKLNAITPHTAVRITKKLATALYATHEKGIIHRDIKPGNVMIDKAGKPWLMDFGLAKGENFSNVTKMGEIVGTPCYMPPEQADSSWGTVDQCSDIYSLGAIFYEMLTGIPPVQGESLSMTFWEIFNRPPEKPSSMIPSLPTKIDEVCLKALEKQKENRYSNAKEFEEALQQIKVRDEALYTKKRTIEHYRKDDSPETRVITDVQTQQVLFALTDALHGDHHNIKKSAVEALGKMGEQALETIPDVINTLKQDHLIWPVVADALGNMGEIGISGVIKELEDEKIRDEIIKVLTRIGESAIPALTRLFESQKHMQKIVLRVFGAMQEIAIETVPMLIESLEKEHLRTDIVDALSEMGASTIPLLVDALQYQHVNLYVAETLGKMGSKATTALIECLYNEEVREMAIEALVHIDTDIIPALIEHSDDEKIHLFVKNIIVRIGSSAVPILLPMFDLPKKREIHFAIVNILTKMGVKIVPELVEEFKKTDSNRTFFIAKAIGNIGEPAIPSLIALIENQVVRAYVSTARALNNIGSQAIAALFDIVKDQNKEIHSLVISLLCNMDLNIVPSILEVTVENNTTKNDIIKTVLNCIVNKPGVDPIVLWIEALHYENVYLFAVEALEKKGTKAIEALVNKLQHTKNRNVIIQTLAHMGSKAVPILIGSCNTNVMSILSQNVFEQMGQKAVPSLLGTLDRANDNEISFAITNALGSMGVEIIPVLIEEFKSPESKKTFFIAKAISAMGEEAIFPILEIISHQDFQAYSSLARALCDINPSTSIHLLNMIQDDQHINSQITNVLMHMDKDIVPTLLEAVKQKNDTKNTIINTVLENMGDTATPLLVNALKDKDLYPFLEELIIKSGKQAIPDLIRAFKYGDKEISSAAVKILEDMGSIAVSALLELIKDNH